MRARRADAKRRSEGRRERGWSDDSNNSSSATYGGAARFAGRRPQVEQWLMAIRPTRRRTPMVRHRHTKREFSDRQLSSVRTNGGESG